jgi:primosomal protein N' (replication factor Y) (superfamily II helicase)
MSERTFFDEGARLGVLTAQPVGGVLDYLAPEGGCWLGALVEVPLGPRRVLGVVWGAGESDLPVARLRAVHRVLDAAPMRDEMREFLTRAAGYTLTPLPAMLRLATRAPGLGDGPAQRRVYRRGDGLPERMTDARARVLAVIEDYGGAGFGLQELAQAAGVTASVVKGLVAAGALREEAAPRDGPYPRLDPARPGPELTAEQAAGGAALRAGVAAGAYGTTLLKGVTGSGKTEVYLEAVAECLSRGRQALVLLPEIALTAEFLARVEARFGARPAEWHSGVTQAERRRCWRMVGQGSAQLVVGARSALFLPFRELGLIVVDEEHDSSYKQEDGVLYHARDMAVLRASIAGCPVVLSSATPSLELGQCARRQIRPHRPGRALRRGRPARDARHRLARREDGGQPLDFAEPGAGGRGAAGGGRADAAVSQPSRLCPGHRLPCLRPPDRLRALRRAHGRAPLPAPPGLPPLRRHPAGARDLPGLRRRRSHGPGRPRGRAAGRRGGGAL